MYNVNGDYMLRDLYWDWKLKIKTIGQDYSKLDDTNYGYDPTPYYCLEKLINSDCIDENDVVIDYGCGKGRVSFYLNKLINCQVIGIDHDDSKIDDCLANNNTSNSNLEFICTKAEEYVNSSMTAAYFFNPFSTEILEQVLSNIITNTSKPVKLFFFYPNEEYVPYLLSRDDISLVGEIECQNLFYNDEYYKFLYFKTLIEAD